MSLITMLALLFNLFAVNVQFSSAPLHTPAHTQQADAIELPQLPELPNKTFVPIVSGQQTTIGEPACGRYDRCGDMYVDRELVFWMDVFFDGHCDESQLGDVPEQYRSAIMGDCGFIVDDLDIVRPTISYWQFVVQDGDCHNDWAHRQHMPEWFAQQLRNRCEAYIGL